MKLVWRCCRTRVWARSTVTLRGTMGKTGFKLKCEPFGDAPDTRFFFESRTHVSAYRRIVQALGEGRRLILLSGPPGSGKSLLARCLMLKQPPADRGALLVCASGDRSPLLERMSRAFGVPVPAGDSLRRAVAALWSSIRGDTAARMVLVIDQAERLPPPMVAQLVQLVRGSDEPGDAPLHVVLIGLAAVASTILDVADAERRVVRVGPLQDLSTAEVASYIAHRWTVAGGGPSPPFTPEALRLIAERSGGNPRQVNRLCTSLLAHVRHGGRSEVEGAMVERVSAGACSPPPDLDADASASGQETSEGSLEMAKPCDDPATALTGATSGCTQRRSAATDAVPAAAGIPASDARASRLSHLVERLERALERAPAVLSAIESATAKPSQLLKQFEARAADLERQQESLTRSLGGLEDTCEKAEQVRHGLAEFVDQLADIGEASQEKVSLLLDSLELGNKTRQELEDSLRRYSETAQRLESTADDCERRLSKSASSLEAEQKRAQRSYIEELKRVYEHTLAPFGKNGEQSSRLAEIVSRGMERIERQAEGKARQIERAAARYAQACESKLSEQQARLAEMAEKAAEQSAARAVEIIRARRDDLEGEHLSRLAEIISRGVEKIGQCADERARQMDRLAARQVEAFESELAKRQARLAETVEKLTAESATRVLETIGAKRDDIENEHVSRLAEIIAQGVEKIEHHAARTVQQIQSAAAQHVQACESSTSKEQQRLAETAEKILARSAAQVSAMLDEKREALECEETSRLAELVSRSVEKIGHYADERSSDIEAAAARHAQECASRVAAEQARLTEIAERIADKSAARVLDTIHAKRDDLEKEIERHLAAFGPDGEHASRLARLVEDGLAAIRTTAQERADGFAEAVQPALARFESMVRAYEARVSRALEGCTAKASEAVDEAVERRADALKETAERYLDQLRKEVDVQSAQLTDRLAQAEETVRSATAGTEEANKILKTLIQNRDFAYEQRLAEVTDASIGRLMPEIDAKCNALEKEIERRLASFAPTGEDTARLAEMISSGIDAIKQIAEEKADEVGATIEQQVHNYESQAAEYEARLAKIADKVVDESAARVVEATQAKRDELHSELERRLAPYGPTGEHTVRLAELVTRGVETLTGVVEKGRREWEEALQRHGAECDAKSSQYERRIADMTREAGSQAIQIIQTRCDDIRKDLEARVAPFEPNGEYYTGLKDLVASARQTIKDAELKSRHSVEKVAVRHERAWESRQAEAEATLTRLTAEAAGRGVQDIRAYGDELKKELTLRLSPFGPSGEYATRLSEMAERGVQEIRSAAEERLRDFRQNVEPAFARFESTIGDLDRRISEAAEQGAAKGVAKIDEAAARGRSALQVAAREHIAQVHAATETATTPLTSQLQASREAVRMVSDSTREAHETLNQLIENRDFVECQMKKLKDDSERARCAAAQLEELQRTAEPTIAELRESLKGTDAATEKIERLIRDVWTLATTAEQRARELRGCSESSAEAVEHLRSAQQNGQKTAVLLESKSADAAAKVAELNTAIQRTGGGVDAVERACRSASATSSELAKATKEARAVEQSVARRVKDAGEAAAHIEGVTQDAGACGTRLLGLTRAAEQHVARQEEATKRCEDVIVRVEAARAAATALVKDMTDAAQTANQTCEALHTALDTARVSIESAHAVADQLAQQIQSGEQSARQHTSLLDAHRALYADLREHIERAQDASKRLEASLDEAQKTRECLGSACKDAATATGQVSSLLTTITERRDALAKHERLANACTRQAESLGVRLRQLQTKADAFDHQLSGMLAEPHKIIEESKAQAEKLNAVCRAVRKVFSGLSKTSLQANRDISRFAEISRQANDRLATLTAETDRTSQTLRQWVNEAAHAQSRLSKALEQVPSIARTHPTTVLADLSNASLKSVPDVLKPSGLRRPQTRADTSTPAPGQGTTEKRGPGTDVAALISEAERVAEQLG